VTVDERIHYITKGHYTYWNLIGTLREVEDHRGEVCYLSGGVSFIYGISSAPGQVSGIIGKIRKKELPGEIALLPESAHLLEAFLADGGFTAGTDWGMAKELQYQPLPPPPKHTEVIRVTGPDRLPACGAILNAAFSYDIFSLGDYQDLFYTSNVRFYLAAFKGLPVAACMTILGEDHADIAWVGTLPGYRGKGIAGALMLTAEQDALAEGIGIAVLTAFPAGFHAYQRIGYEKCCDITVLSYSGSPIQ
jgi:GNAT superfamily N-acetyltransferase